MICKRIKLIKLKRNPYFVTELKTGYVVLGDYQLFRGYALLLCKIHKQELHQLPVAFRKQFLWEMALVAEAVYRAFRPIRLNYELLGNTDHHLHWHIFPRHANDPLPNRTVWNISKKIRFSKRTKPSKKTLEIYKIQLKKELDRLIKKTP